VGFIYGDQPKIDISQRCPYRRFETLRGCIDKLVLTSAHAVDPICSIPGGETGVEIGGPQPGLVETVHLILHESDER